MKSFEEIWKSFVAGEELSFRYLIFSHYDTLYNYGSKFTNNTELVKDAIQDLFLNLWNKRRSINQPENVRAYLYSSLRRLIHRKIKLNNKLYTEGEKFSTDFRFQVSVEQQYIRNEAALNLAGKIAHSIEKLPPRQKEVIFLKFYQGFSRNEIAETMEIGSQTVSNLLQIALSKLRDDLGHSFDPRILYFVIPLLLKGLV